MLRSAVLACAALSPCALAQVGPLVEIRVVGEGEGVNGYGRVEASFLFDTGKAVTDNVFKAVDATAVFSMDETPGPFDLTGGVYKQDEGAVALLELVPDQGGYALTIIGRAPDPHVSFKLGVVNARGFQSEVDTLPADPDAYFVGAGGHVQLQYAEEQGSIASIYWSTPGFDGGKFSITVREAEPEPADLCDADLAEPFGVLDFGDVLAYLSAFGAGCP